MATIDLELIHLSWLAAEEEKRQKNIVLARNYFAGEQFTELTKRQKQFLGFKDSGRFCLNYCRSVVQSVAERLIVAGFKSVDEAFSDWAWSVWAANRMDALQMEVHQGAVCDGEYFVFVSWDEEQERVLFTPHPRYTAPEAEGTGFGCKVFFEDDDPTGPPVCATKRWTQTTYNDRGKRETRRRMNIYYPERIEKYVMGTSGAGGEAMWQEYREEGEAWPLPWEDNSGEPLGIPIIGFFNPQHRTELWDAIPIQDALNKTALDILASADATGFPVRVTSGFYLTTDGKMPADDNLVEFTPGMFLYVPEGQNIQELDIPSLQPLLEAFDNWVVRLGQVTDTPLSRFQLTRQVVAEDTLKQQESPLLAKIRDRQTRFGNAWEDCYSVAAKLERMWGNPQWQPAKGKQEPSLSTLWEPAETRGERERIETIGQKVEKLHIPLIQAWQEAGYTQEEIEDMQESPEYQARLAQMNLASVALGGLEGSGNG